MKNPSTRQALFELVLAAALWGFGFIAVKWGLESSGPLWLNTFRLLLGAVSGLAVIAALPKLRRFLTWKEFGLGFSPGIALGVCLILQTYGLQYTTVTKSGFITCLYIVFVPLLSVFFHRTRVAKAHSAWVVVALIGAALVCQVDSVSVNLGDWLTLACALGAAVQIVEVGRLTRMSGSAFVFTVNQSFWAALPPLIGGLFWEAPPTMPLTPRAVCGILVLVFGCTLLAFGIQSRTQRVLSPSVVSLIFLLEAPFAAIFAYLCLGERMTLGQGIGGILILAAAALSIRSDRS